MLHCSVRIDARCEGTSNDCLSNFPKQLLAVLAQSRNTFRMALLLLLAIAVLSIAPVQAQHVFATQLPAYRMSSGLVRLSRGR